METVSVYTSPDTAEPPAYVREKVLFWFTEVELTAGLYVVCPWQFTVQLTEGKNMSELPVSKSTRKNKCTIAQGANTWFTHFCTLLEEFQLGGYRTTN
jgi:hypothetical protein